jgi:hypothetical protein
MDKQERIREIILQLKTIKADQELTNQDILEMVEASGGITSISTIRRVFAEGSENQSFNFRNTIQPISRAMLATNETTKVSDQDENLLQAQLDGLKQVCELKDTLLNDLQKALEAEQRKVEFLKLQVEQKDRIINNWLDSQKPLSPT